MQASSREVGGAPFLYVSTTPNRRQKLQNASSNCLWVLERTHCALGGRPLRRTTNPAYQQGSTPQGTTPNLTASSAANAAATGSGSDAERRRSDANSGAGNTEAGRGSASVGTGGNTGVGVAGGAGGVGASSSTAAISSFFAGGGRDGYAEAVAKRRKRQGAGDAVEHVRVKHLATSRYLCVGKKCDPVSGADTRTPASDAGTGGEHPRAGGFRRRGEGKKDRGVATRVGMVTAERHAAIPAATVFVIRPRIAVGTGAPAVAAAADGGLGPEDLVHLQHKDTGLFLSALPRVEGWVGGRVGLTMVKSPLTTEASTSYSICCCILQGGLDGVGVERFLWALFFVPETRDGLHGVVVV